MTSLTDRLAFVYCLCEEQTKELDVSPEEFEQRLYGGEFAKTASDAFIGECADFTRNLGEEALAKIAERQLKTISEARQRISDRVASGEFDEDLERAHQEMMDMIETPGQ